MDLFAAIVESDNAKNTCDPKVSQACPDFLPMNKLVLQGPPPPQVTFRGRNQQQGIRAIVDAYMHYTPATVNVAYELPSVARDDKAVGETSLDYRKTMKQTQHQQQPQPLLLKSSQRPRRH